MNKTEHIEAINRAIRQFTPHKGSLTPTEPSPDPRPGQVWTTHPEPRFSRNFPWRRRIDDPFRMVLLKVNDAEENGHTVHVAAPLLEETHMAGPEDVLLPKEVFGYRVAVAIGSSVTVLHDSLSSCIGTLPQEWSARLDTFLAFVEGIKSARPEVLTGPDYLDQMDIRYVFHQKLVDRLAYIQEPVFQWLRATERQAKTVDLWDTGVAAIREIWEGLKGKLWSPVPQLGYLSAPPPAFLPCVNFGTAGAHVSAPVILVTKGCPKIVATAEESVPLPSESASWRVVRGARRVAGRRFAVVPGDSDQVLCVGKASKNGARLTATEVRIRKSPPQGYVLVLME